MKELTIEEITEKYRNIEDKIPSVWSDYKSAGIELSQDIVFHWNIKSSELIRVIALMEIRIPEFHQNQHIDNRFAFAGLYPERMKTFDIKPDDVKPKSPVSEWNETQISIFENLLVNRISFKDRLKEDDEELKQLQKELNKLKEDLNQKNKL